MPLSNIKIHRSGPEMLNELIGRLPTSDLERWALKTAGPPFLLQLATPRSMESTMNPERLFKVTEFLQPAEGEPIRSVITESARRSGRCLVCQARPKYLGSYAS